MTSTDINVTRYQLEKLDKFLKTSRKVKREAYTILKNHKIKKDLTNIYMHEFVYLWEKYSPPDQPFTFEDDLKQNDIKHDFDDDEMFQDWKINTCWCKDNENVKGNDELKKILEIPQDLNVALRLADILKQNESRQTQPHEFVKHISISPPFYIKESLHYENNIGNGLFALNPILPGQCFLQYKGKITLRKKQDRKQDFRSNYLYSMDYKKKEYIINPLDKNNNLEYTYLASFINEPSNPPFKPGEAVIFNYPGIYDISHRIANSEEREMKDTEIATVIDFDNKWKTYTIRFDDGTHFQWVEPEYLRYKNSTNHIDSYRANSIWFHLPVPIEIYTQTDTDQNDSSIGIFELSNNIKTCLVEYTIGDLFKCFKTITDESGTYECTLRYKHLLKVHTVLLLNENIFDGLYQESIVTKINDQKISVKHFTNTDRYKLPTTIKAGYNYQTKQYIPFPLIYACRHISTDEEILVLYSHSKKNEQRGAPCMDVINGEFDGRILQKEWSHVCEQ